MSVWKRPNGRYAYDFWIQRVRFCGETGCTSERAAREFERGRKAQARERLAALKEQAAAPMTVSAAFDRFWLDLGRHYGGTYGRTVFTALGWLMDRLGPQTLLRDIGPAMVNDAIAARRGEGVRPATVNRTVTELLRRILRRAATKWEAADLQRIDWTDMLLDEPKERVRELRDHEEDTVFGGMRADYVPALRFKLASGCRRSEVIGLAKADVDWTARSITVLGKGKRPRTIPLTAEIAAILSPLRDHHDTMFFTYVARRTVTDPKSKRRLVKGRRYPITASGFATAWRRYGRALLTDFRMHDFRHTTATRLLRETGNLKLVQRLLGHENVETTVKYAHADDADLRAAMERLAQSRRKSRKSRSDVA